ncbi:MAG TPA: proline dehydrogenase family protein [Longimicrobiales bacterium]|nr:proline dehydrogenase family protein [Longimicrobiales bacterium]
MLRETLIMLSESSTARRFVKSAPGARTMARRFVAGETIDDGMRAVRAVNQRGMSATLDYLGESVRNREEARAAADVYMRALERIADEKLNANVSLKLTQMGQDIDETFLRENVGRLLDRAAASAIFVRFDMEASSHTQRTLDFFRRLWAEGYRNIGVVIQSYLRRSAGDIEQLNRDQVRVRLCKGAYKEPPAAAFQLKREVDDNYVELMRSLLAHGNYPGIATHDERMIDATRAAARQLNQPPASYEFQMLYGIRRDLQQRLVAAGYNLRVYVPFGEAWYPYLMRRMAERPANLFFILNAVVRESPLGRFGRSSA